jgi:hypothetical protein
MSNKTKNDATALEPWQRRSDESDKAFAAFQCYLDLGVQRSYREVAKKLGKSETIMARWSAKYGWRDRCSAHQDEMVRRQHEAEMAEAERLRKERAKRDIALADRIQDIAEKRLFDEKYAKKVHQARDVLAFARTAVSMRREITGDAHHKEQPQPAPVVNLFDIIKKKTDELRVKIIEDLLREQAAREALPPKVVEALPAPEQPPANEVIESTPHPNDATNRGQQPRKDS